MSDNGLYAYSTSKFWKLVISKKTKFHKKKRILSYIKEICNGSNDGFIKILRIVFFDKSVILSNLNINEKSLSYSSKTRKIISTGIVASVFLVFIFWLKIL